MINSNHQCRCLNGRWKYVPMYTYTGCTSVTRNDVFLSSGHSALSGGGGARARGEARNPSHLTPLHSSVGVCRSDSNEGSSLYGATYSLIVIRGFISDGSCNPPHIFHVARKANRVIFAFMPWSFIDFRFLVESETNETSVNGDAPAESRCKPHRWYKLPFSRAHIRKP